MAADPVCNMLGGEYGRTALGTYIAAGSTDYSQVVSVCWFVSPGSDCSYGMRASHTFTLLAMVAANEEVLEEVTQELQGA